LNSVNSVTDEIYRVASKVFKELDKILEDDFHTKMDDHFYFNIGEIIVEFRMRIEHEMPR